VKTKIERKGVTRGRAILFDVMEVLFNESQCKQGQHAKPFSVVIPTTIQKHVGTSGNDAFLGIDQWGMKKEWSTSKDFLSTADNVGNLPLPFSYYYNAADMGVKGEAFVEYVLQAETAVSEEAARSKISANLTILPLIVRIPRAEELETPRLITRNFPGWVRAYSTDVDFDKSRLTFGQKMKKTFRSSSFPRFGFDIVVATPTHI
jgi:hypothetical protein